MKGAEQQLPAAEEFIGGNDGAYAQPAVLIAPLDAEIGVIVRQLIGQTVPVKGPGQKNGPLPDGDRAPGAEAAVSGAGCDPQLRKIGHALIKGRTGGDIGKSARGGGGEPRHL